MEPVAQIVETERFRLSPTATLKAYLILTREQVQEVLQITDATLKTLTTSGLLPPVKVGGRNYWKPETVRAYVDSLKPVG